MKHVKHPGLVAEMAKAGITQREIAAALNVSARTLYNRIIGKQDFTWRETCIIQNTFFPNLPKEVLFHAEVS